MRLVLAMVLVGLAALPLSASAKSGEERHTAGSRQFVFLPEHLQHPVRGFPKRPDESEVKVEYVTPTPVQELEIEERRKRNKRVAIGVTVSIVVVAVAVGVGVGLTAGLRSWN